MFVLLYALRPSIIFGAAAKDEPYNWVAKLGIACWCAHFAKREIETFFVHKFSRYYLLVPGTLFCLFMLQQ